MQQLICRSSLQLQPNQRLSQGRGRAGLQQEQGLLRLGQVCLQGGRLHPSAEALRLVLRLPGHVRRDVMREQHVRQQSIPLSQRGMHLAVLAVQRREELPGLLGRGGLSREDLCSEFLSVQVRQLHPLGVEVRRLDRLRRQVGRGGDLQGRQVSLGHVHLPERPLRGLDVDVQRDGRLRRQFRRGGLSVRHNR